MWKKLRLKYSILLGYVVPLLLLLTVAIVMLPYIKEAEDQWDLVQVTFQMVEDSKDLVNAVKSIESAAHAYVHETNEEAFKEYQSGVKASSDILAALGEKVRDPTQQATLRKMRDASAKVLAQYSRLISLAGTGKAEAAVEYFRGMSTERLTSELDALAGEFEAREHEIFQQREKTARAALDILPRILVLGISLSIVLAIASGLWIASRIASSLAETVNALSSTTTEISSTVAEHERTASQQASLVSETSTTMAELGASSRKTAEQAEAAAGVAQRATTLTQEGSESVKAALEAMSNLRGRIEAVARQILRLSEQTIQVGGIAELVKDLSTQINMLALNAAVEAARAGEHGKGFAVVAGEVRKLAAESKKSSEQAKALLAEIQKATNSTIMVTEEGTKQVEEVAALAHKVGDLFLSLSENADQVFNTAQQVLLNARQQTAAIGQVTEASNTINAGAKETAAGISQTKVGVLKLNEAAQNLKVMI